MCSAAMLLALLAHTASASISLLTFPQPNCNGLFGTNVRSVASEQSQASGCVATAGFESIRIDLADPGFVCNIYSDLECANFLAQTSTSSDCQTMNGNAVICFSQNDFDGNNNNNPPNSGAAPAKAELFMSADLVASTSTGGDMVGRAASQACGDNGICDAANQFVLLMEQNPLTGPTAVTVSMAGKYANTQQRDYMVLVLQEAFNMAQSPERDGIPIVNLTPSFGLPQRGPKVRDIPTLGRVILSDASGVEVADMTVSITSQDAVKEEICQNTVGKISEDAIAAIPMADASGALDIEIICLGFRLPDFPF